MMLRRSVPTRRTTREDANDEIANLALLKDRKNDALTAMPMMARYLRETHHRAIFLSA